MHACRRGGVRAKRAGSPGFSGAVSAGESDGMRLVLRVVGTLLIAFAVILIIIDGTRSLAANSLVFTPLEVTWQNMHSESLVLTREFLGTRLFGAVLQPLVAAILNLPGWAVIGVPGLLLAWAGRSRRERVFLRHDQI